MGGADSQFRNRIPGESIHNNAIESELVRYLGIGDIKHDTEM